MAHSLELRVPFLDSEVAAMALGLATPLKVRGLAKKRLLRRALRRCLPKEVLRGRKQGFSIPVAAWLRGPLQGSRAKSLSAETLARQGWLDPAAVAACSTATAPAARTSAGSSGADRLHTLVRPLCPLALEASSPSSSRGPRAAARAAHRSARAPHRRDRHPDDQRRCTVPTPRWAAWRSSPRSSRGADLAALGRRDAAILAGAALITVVGMLDDVYELGAAPKLLGQTWL
jgi:hypothetical protein